MHDSVKELGAKRNNRLYGNVWMECKERVYRRDEYYSRERRKEMYECMYEGNVCKYYTCAIQGNFAYRNVAYKSRAYLRFR